MLQLLRKSRPWSPVNIQRPEANRQPASCREIDRRPGPALSQTVAGILLAHEDKIYEGALIASLSIPWGEAKSDDDLGGYTWLDRDMCNSATG